MINNWILAIRPKTLFASIAPVILGTSIAYTELHFIHYMTAFITLVTALFLQVASNLANDYLDSIKGIDTEKRLGPIRVTQSGLISPEKMKQALILVLSISLLLGCYLMWIGGPVIIFIGLISLYFSYGYSGGPFPLSHNGLGEVAAFIFFGIIAVGGANYLQTHHFSILALILGAGPGFISATILAINNLRDIHTDTETNKKTIAVIFGESFQRKLCLILISLSSIVLIITAIFFDYQLLYFLAILPIFFIKNWLHIYKHQIDQSMNTALANTAKYLLIYCLLTSLGLLLSNGNVL